MVETQKRVCPNFILSDMYSVRELYGQARLNSMLRRHNIGFNK